jgi:hypothetical protein
MGILSESGKGTGFKYILSPPLRTVHTTFTVHGSSNLYRFTDVTVHDRLDGLP